MDAMILKAVVEDDYAQVLSLLDQDQHLISTKDEGGLTPLLLAVENGSEALVDLLLERGADIHEGDVPLLLAVRKRRKNIVQLLLDRGADVNKPNRSGWTALQEAADDDCYAITQLLLKHGANANAADSRGRTPLARATMDNHSRVAELLSTHGAAG